MRLSDALSAFRNLKSIRILYMQLTIPPADRVIKINRTNDSCYSENNFNQTDLRCYENYTHCYRNKINLH